MNIVINGITYNLVPEIKAEEEKPVVKKLKKRKAIFFSGRELNKGFVKITTILKKEHYKFLETNCHYRNKSKLIQHIFDEFIKNHKDTHGIQQTYLTR